MNNRLFCIVFVFLFLVQVFPVRAQTRTDRLRPLQGNPVLESVRKQSPFRIKSGEKASRYLTLPFFDDFSGEGPYPSPLRWSDNTVFVNSSFPLYPPTYGAATFDGLDAQGRIYSHARTGSSFWADTLTSLPLRLDSIFEPEARALGPADSIYLSFCYQPGGGLGDAWSQTRRGTAPAKADLLNLEFYQPEDSSWETVWSAAGTDMEDFCPLWDSAGYPVQEQRYFRKVMVPITAPVYFHKDFRFRFRGKSTIDANLKSTGGQWHIDYVYVDKGRSCADSSVTDVAFADVSPSLLREYSQVPYRQFDPVMLRPQLDLRLTNLGTQVLACHYRYQILDGQGREVYAYPVSGTADVQMYPFDANGYRTEPDLSSVAMDYAFPGAGSQPQDYSVRHMLSSGIGNAFSQANDTLVFPQAFSHEFAYDDGTAEAGWGLNYSGGAVAYAFELTVPDSLTAIRIFFNRSFADENLVAFNLLVWAAGSSDTVPGEILYRQEGLEARAETGLNRFANYPLETPVLLPAGKFYIGIEQLSSTFMNIGFDQNSSLSGKLLYSYYDPLLHAWTWYPSLYKGALMMRPAFGAQGALSNNRETLSGERKIRVYPNPVREGAFRLLLPEGVDGKDLVVALFDMRGRMIWQKPYREYFSLERPVSGIYFLRLMDRNKVLGFSKLVVVD